MGYFRFILAVAVSANHLWVIGGIGRYAVFSFYILSGYLMTTIVMDRYGTNITGLKKYAANRFLRIYPIYWICLLVSLLGLYFLGTGGIQLLDKNLSIPNGISSWIMNTTLIGLDFNVTDRSIPPSWTLFVEIFYYAMIPLAVRAGGKFILCWLIASVLYHVYMIIIPHGAMYGWNERYGTVMAGSLGFSIGCFLRYNPLDWMLKREFFRSSVLSMVICYAVTSYWFLQGPTKWQLNFMSIAIFYANMIASAILVVNLFATKQGRIGNLLGDFSYPFYLMHLPIGYFIFKVLNLTARSFGLWIAGVIATIGFCFAIRLIDKKINRIRDSIKSGI